MITTLFSLYASGTLAGFEMPKPPLSLWKEEIRIQESSVPVHNPRFIAPVIEAKSAIAIDLESGFILYEKNIHERLPIASLTKLMTSILVLEKNNLDEIITVSKKAAQVEGSKIWLPEGEKMTVENLLYASLIHSANDAAYALAENNSESIENFIKKMNEKAVELGLYQTHFTTPIGLDEKDNYSTVHDLSLLAHYAYNQNFIQKTVGLKELEVKSSSGNNTYKLENTNELLSSYLKVLGLKTGTTDEAGQCFIAIIENEEGHKIMTIVLNSQSRFQETKVLADWVFRSYQWK